MDVVFDGVLIKNFKGIKELYVNFSDNTTIFGQNATGKTTIVDAVTYCLFGTDSLGNSKFEIRPLDKNGNKIHNIVISVCLFLRIDGKKTELKRELSENWVKKRGSENPVLQGNVGSYEIDGYPRSEKDYKEYINGIVNDDLFKMLTNPTYFPNMPWKDQRATIMKFASDVSDVELATEDSRFAVLLPEIEKAPSTDDIKNKYQKSLNELKKKQMELPVRIDEVSKTKVDIDVAELELQKNALKEQIDENKAKQDDVSKQYEEYQKLSDGILEMKLELNGLQQKANLDLEKKRAEIRGEISTVDNQIADVARQINLNRRNIKSVENAIKENEAERAKQAELWNAAKARVFDENSLICSYCGQEYPADKKEQLRAEYEAHRAEEIRRIEEEGSSLKEAIEKGKAELERLKVVLKEYEDSEITLTESIRGLESAYAEIPTLVDISDTDEYKVLTQQISEKEAAMQKENSADEIRKSLKAESEDLQSQLTEVEKKIALSENNIKIDERIEELQAEQRITAQKIADVEKMLYLLDEFIKYKLDKISDSINAMFDGISFKLFDIQLNGGVKEVCECTVNGVPYGSLNNGHRIIAGLQIIKALQKLYGVYLPIFTDNAESVNDFNLPDMDCQLIKLKVSDDKDLRIEVE